MLGGHDHEYFCQGVKHELKDPSLGVQVESKIVPMVKSATDFLDMSEIDITFDVTEADYNRYAESCEDSKEQLTEVYYSKAD